MPFAKIKEEKTVAKNVYEWLDNDSVLLKKGNFFPFTFEKSNRTQEMS